MKSNYYVACLTAFNSDGSIDFPGNHKLWDYLINHGIKGLLVLGSSGEFYAMTAEERKALMKDAKAYIGSRAKLFFGTGSCNTDEALALSEYAEELHADGIMVISPYYFGLSAEAIREYYGAIADAVHIPMYLYNFPARTGYSLQPDVILQLKKEHANIVGIKDSVAEFGHTREIITTVCKEFPDFEVYSGFDENLMHVCLSGGSGVIGAIPNVCPEICSGFEKAIEENDLKKISQYQKKIDVLMKIFSINSSYIATAKAGMQLMGVDVSNKCREPIVSLKPEEIDPLKAVLDRALN